MRADRDSVRRKLKIARGQLDGILQMIDDDRYCVDISNQLLATQSLLKSANQQTCARTSKAACARLCDRPYRPQARRGLPAPRAHGAVVTAQKRTTAIFSCRPFLLFDQILAVEFLFRKLLCGVLMYELEYYRREGNEKHNTDKAEELAAKQCRKERPQRRKPHAAANHMRVKN